MRTHEPLAWERRSGAAPPVEVDATAHCVAELLAARQPLEANGASVELAVREAVAALGDPEKRGPVRARGAAVALRLAERGQWNADEVAPGDVVDLVVARSGLPTAIDAVLAADGFALVHTEPLSLREDIGSVDFASGGEGGLRRLRARILSADEAAHRAAEEAAEGHRARGSFEARCAVAFLFPHRPDWARELVATLAEARSDAPALLLGCAIDGDALAKIVAGGVDLGRAAQDGRLAETFRRLGGAVLPAAARLVARRPTLRRAVVDALAALDRPEVAEVLVAAYADEAVRGAVRVALARHPEAALDAVAKRLASKSAEAPLLKPLLATLVHAAPERAIAVADSAAKKERAALLAAGARTELLGAVTPAIASALDAPLGDPDAEEAWAKLAGWLRAKAPRAGLDAVTAVASRAGAQGTRRLAELARVLGRNDGVGAALGIVDALEEKGTSLALREIARFATEATDPALGHHAEEVLRRIQNRLALDDQAMADRVVPDCGIDGAAVTLDFGPRAFLAELDAELRPRLLDASGKVLKSLPRPTKKDDAHKAARATATWTDFRLRASGEAREQARRFEAAMVAGRAYEAAVFRDVLLDHPILAGLARRILWRTAEGATFRVAEDLTLADQDDLPFTLPATSPVHVVHPLELAPEARDAWGRVFADYEIVSPFEQLARELHVLPENTVARLQEALAEFVGKPAARGARQILEREDFEDAFDWSSISFSREVRGVSTKFVLRLPDPEGAPDEIEAVSVGVRADPAVVDPVGASEALRAVRLILSKRST